MSRHFTITEIAQETGLSTDTLRYYEKFGLIESPVRGAGNIRRYTEVDLGKIKFITYLRDTKMPLKNIQAYVQAYNQQDETQCYKLLDEHRIRVEAQLEQITKTLDLLQYKLKHFQEIKDGKREDDSS